MKIVKISSLLPLLHDLVAKSGRFQKELADELGFSESYVSRVANKKAEGSEKFWKIVQSAHEKHFGPPENQPISAAESNRRSAPVVSFAKAGQAYDYEEVMNQLEQLINTSSKSRKAYGLIIEGDSMEPTCKPGSVVIFEGDSIPLNGKPVVAKHRDGRVMFKRFYRSGNRVTLKSDNPKYSDIVADLSEFEFIHPAFEMRTLF